MVPARYAEEMRDAAAALRRSLAVKRRRGGAPAPARTGLIDACGCAMSAAFMGVGILVALAWVGALWPLGAWAIAWRVLVAAFGLAVVGKFVGMGLYRLRRR
jgi:hypothetical protein